jgi:hypothetical protein
MRRMEWVKYWTKYRYNLGMIPKFLEPRVNDIVIFTRGGQDLARILGVSGSESFFCSLLSDGLW